MAKPLVKISFPSINEVLTASDKKILTWFDRFSAPATGEEIMVMKLIIKRKNKIKQNVDSSSGNSR